MNTNKNLRRNHRFNRRINKTQNDAIITKIVADDSPSLQTTLI